MTATSGAAFTADALLSPRAAAMVAALAAAGLPRVRFHDLRHSCASFLLAAGVPVRQVADVLGHAQIALTLSIYAHVMPSEFQRSADVMEGILTGRK